LELTAAIFYVSKEYLSKVFKATVGMGFQEYLTSLRMERAKELILSYKVPLKDIGELVGYLDQAHFYKTFKRFYGKTPGEIRSLIIDNK
jgi:two-component system response regulator YesN